jgi:uncharacterized protein (TIGR02231 family)
MTRPSTPGAGVTPREEQGRLAFFPKLDESRRVMDAPVREVTLLEDRAQVRRSGRVALSPGLNRLVIRDVAPVLQDLSLRGTASPAARVVDARARRAVRVRSADKPEAAREIEQEIEKLSERFTELGEDRVRAEERQAALLEILSKGTLEIPQDAAWGLVNQQTWHDTFETLSKRSRALAEKNLELHFAQADLSEEIGRLSEKRLAFDRWDTDFVAWIEVDLEATEAGEAEVVVEYVVANALWRPMHSARLAASEGRLRWRSLAAVWQNTGEDWREAQLVFSTARASLGTDPPLLSDDQLEAQRKPERVVVKTRQVAVQTTGPGRASRQPPSMPRTLELPGVDDGGDIQSLRARGLSTVPSDGRLNIVPLLEFETAADCQLVTMPELEAKVFLKTTQSNEAPRPILAGPVELIRDSGVIGWTKVMYVAPQERFELSFGHDDGLRLYRTLRREARVDEVDKWTHTDTHVTVFLSNLEGREKRLRLAERIPVSEIEHVRVQLLEKDCQPALPELDPNGFCSWDLTLPARGLLHVTLGWRFSVAPGVEQG